MQSKDSSAFNLFLKYILQFMSTDIHNQEVFNTQHLLKHFLENMIANYCVGFFSQSRQFIAALLRNFTNC